MAQLHSGVSAVVLGIMQDGGLPHIGCQCPRCRAAFDAPRITRYAASLALIDRRQEPAGVWIIDATPDIKWQLQMLAVELGPHVQRGGRLRQPDGVFLTHAHLGHIGGLPQLGPEAMAVRDLPLYATPELAALLQATDLWRPAVSRCSLRPIAPGEALQLAPGLSVTVVPVPHRDEWNVGTVAYHVAGPQKTLLYLPDIDSWDQWPEASAVLASVNIALIDACFFSADELDSRAPVTHPLVPDTLERFREIGDRLLLTHINHSNPILDETSPERKVVYQYGAGIAYRGLTIDL
jgi:pyrroloquinoline quinone biosynthesis protein B